jgi:hypothetical protein
VEGELCSIANGCSNKAAPTNLCFYLARLQGGSYFELQVIKDGTLCF